MSNKSFQIKVCGMRDPHNLEQICELSPDLVGFIFHPGSHRFVGNHPDPALFDIPGVGIKKVGVFVNQELTQVRKAIEQHGLDGIQLHGVETVQYCRELKGDEVEVIKVLDPSQNSSDWEEYAAVADFFLFDSAGQGSGGTGKKFDWKLFNHLHVLAPFFLSGGIGPEDASVLRNIDLKSLIGVDVNSRFELSPGIKDKDRLKEFIFEIRK